MGTAINQIATFRDLYNLNPSSTITQQDKGVTYGYLIDNSDYFEPRDMTYLDELVSSNTYLSHAISSTKIVNIPAATANSVALKIDGSNTYRQITIPPRNHAFVTISLDLITPTTSIYSITDLNPSVSPGRVVIGTATTSTTGTSYDFGYIKTVSGSTSGSNSIGIQIDNDSFEDTKVYYIRILNNAKAYNDVKLSSTGSVLTSGTIYTNGVVTTFGYVSPMADKLIKYDNVRSKAVTYNLISTHGNYNESLTPLIQFSAQTAYAIFGDYNNSSKAIKFNIDLKEGTTSIVNNSESFAYGSYSTISNYSDIIYPILDGTLQYTIDLPEGQSTNGKSAAIALTIQLSINGEVINTKTNSYTRNGTVSSSTGVATAPSYAGVGTLDLGDELDKNIEGSVNEVRVDIFFGGNVSGGSSSAAAVGLWEDEEVA